MGSNQEINYWLKPIGTSADNKSLNQEKKADFAERCFGLKYCQFKYKVEKIKDGDILICYLSGVQQLIYVSEVKGGCGYYKEPKNTAEERWPYYVNVKTYPSLLLDNKIYLKDLKNKYLADDAVTKCISVTGAKDFKEIRRRDRLALDKDFSKFILAQIK